LKPPQVGRERPLTQPNSPQLSIKEAVEQLGLSEAMVCPYRAEDGLSARKGGNTLGSSLMGFGEIFCYRVTQSNPFPELPILIPISQIK